MIETKSCLYAAAGVLICGTALCCMAPSQEPMMAPSEAEPESVSEVNEDALRDEAAPLKKMSKRARRSRGSGRAKAGLAAGAMPAAPSVDEEVATPEDDADDSTPATPARSWFPETFLFAPAVATDEAGSAQVTVTVPDRLTTWRILALAHDRAGGRGGAVSTFDSVLPTYVDPVLPDGLIAGDRIELPVLVVNTTDARVRRTLRVQARGAGMQRVTEPVNLGPGESVVRHIPVDVKQPGFLGLSYSLGGVDRVERQVPVQPPGRPRGEQKTGALADKVAFDIKLPADARPQSVQVGLTVYPGALALLRSELSQASGRLGLAEAAYGLHAAGVAAPLIARLGGKPEPMQLRKLRLQAGQRVLRASRRPGLQEALLIAMGVGPHGADPLLGRLKQRMARFIAGLQRPDGTFTDGDGWPLQRVVVATASALYALRAVADDDAGRRWLRGARIRAEGAFERYIDAVKDPYTAATILAVDGVRGTLAAKLRARVREALSGKEALELRPAANVVRVDGVRPSVAEATAFAVLALNDDPESKDKLPGLGNRLLSAYRPRAGWGDGRANLVALFAATLLFAEPLPDRVDVALYNGDAVVAQTLLAGPDRTERHEVRAWTPSAAKTSRWRIEATPPVPGLAYAFDLDYRVPWKAAPPSGLTLQAEVAGRVRVGEPVRVTLLVDGPAGAPLDVRYGLPAGLQPVRSDWEAMVRDRRVEQYRIDARGIEFKVPRRAPGKAARLTFQAVPSFAGRLQAEASYVTLTQTLRPYPRRGPRPIRSAGPPSTRVFVAPKTWTIRR